MPYAMHMRWPGVTIEQYEQVRDKVRWEEDQPDGGLLHVSAHDGEALRVFDLWESPQQFQEFVDSRLMPGVQAAGIQAEPEVTLCEVHRMYAPRPIESGAGILV
jgi:hypothetical protein